MDAWRARWRDGKIGFHEGRPNAYLESHYKRLDQASRILVPLCGKAEDLAFLAAHGHTVVGVELVEDAVAAFFAEHQLTPTITPRGDLIEYVAGGITIYTGDLFTVTPDLIGTCDGLYDRAALIAVDPDVRARYVAHVRTLVRRGGRALVITLEYAQDKFVGPPFAVLEREVRELYRGCEIVLVAEGADTRVRDAASAPPMTERCYAITL